MSNEAETVEERSARLQALADSGGHISIEEYRKKSRRSFLGFAASAVGGFLGFKHIQGRPQIERTPDVLRWGLEANEAIWETINRDGAESRTYDISGREDLRVNGRLGMRNADRSFNEIDLDTWSMQIVGVDGNELETVTMSALANLEVHDMVWEHKCIEGWSNIVHWTGARFSDFVQRYADDLPPYEYVSLRTPDERYFVGMDTKTMMHSQTLLAWGLNGEPLSQRHGAPLRLVTPLKYGIKQLKRIGIIEFTNDRPSDYWGDRGYDWHAGF